jgi:hypothetical protein
MEAGSGTLSKRSQTLATYRENQRYWTRLVHVSWWCRVKKGRKVGSVEALCRRHVGDAVSCSVTLGLRFPTRILFTMAPSPCSHLYRRVHRPSRCYFVLLFLFELFFTSGSEGVFAIVSTIPTPLNFSVGKFGPSFDSLDHAIY